VAESVSSLTVPPVRLSFEDVSAFIGWTATKIAPATTASTAKTIAIFVMPFMPSPLLLCVRECSQNRFPAASHAAQIARIACLAVGNVLGAERDFHVVLLAYQGVVRERLSADHAFHALLFAETAYNPACETGFRSSCGAVSAC
jgi:hypothetical protein